MYYIYTHILMDTAPITKPKMYTCLESINIPWDNVTVKKWTTFLMITILTKGWVLCQEYKSRQRDTVNIDFVEKIHFNHSIKEVHVEARAYVVCLTGQATLQCAGRGTQGRPQASQHGHKQCWIRNPWQNRLCICFNRKKTHFAEHHWV